MSLFEWNIHSHISPGYNHISRLINEKRCTAVFSTKHCTSSCTEYFMHVKIKSLSINAFTSPFIFSGERNRPWSKPFSSYCKFPNLVFSLFFSDLFLSKESNIIIWENNKCVLEARNKQINKYVDKCSHEMWVYPACTGKLSITYSKTSIKIT